MKIVLPELFPQQHAVATDPTRFRVLVASRRWGKTHLAAWCCLAEALRGKEVWWVAPTYSIGAIAWQQLAFMCVNLPVAKVKPSERTIEFHLSGNRLGRIQIKSADNETSLLGAGLDFCVIEEAAYIKESVWYYRLRPTLSDKKGRALFISTPNGKNYFYDLWRKGGTSPEWKSWLLTCHDSPTLTEAEIEAARQDLPARVFAREYLCSFADSGQGIFNNLDVVLTAVIQTRGDNSHSYVAGVDIGRSNDYTVIVTLDETTMEVVNVERFTGIGFQRQFARIIENHKAFRHRKILIETNNMGQSVYEEMRLRNLPAVGFTTTNQTKRNIIEKLVMAIENQRIALPNLPELVNEFMLFEERQTNQGLTVTYRAAKGSDDIVMATALAYHATDVEHGYVVDVSKFDLDSYQVM